MSYSLPYLGLGEREADLFAATLSAILPPVVVAHGHVATAAKKMLSSLEDLASPQVVEKRRKHFSVVSADLLTEKVICREGDRVVISGLRFNMLNIDFPFVHLTANFLPNTQEILNLKSMVASAYAPMELKGITIWQPPGAFSDVATKKWSHTLFGETTNPNGQGLPDSLNAKWGGENEFFDQYAKEFKEFIELHPDKRSYLRMETQEDLAKASGQGLLMSLFDEEGWAGAIAGRPKNFYGLPCVYIFELFLAKRWRGKRVAQPMQAKFLSEISGRFPYVYGYINDANLPSLKTAQSVSREIVGSEYFFAIER